MIDSNMKKTPRPQPKESIDELEAN
ncbi:uncharacterized protein METZ01_LOCUS132231 [marine metagenome]|uniref:Uncharacterized protein n=1 Tax=marine metagenome TaxID=408172 RepID=A0A381YSB4_9ZZZZ